MKPTTRLDSSAANKKMKIPATRDDDKFNDESTSTTTNQSDKTIIIKEEEEHMFQSCRYTLESYWNLYEIPNGDDHSQELASLANEIFNNDAIWESQRLEQPILGIDNIIQHIQRIKSYTIDGIKTRSEPIFQYQTIIESDNRLDDGKMIITATWDWKVTRYSDNTTISGTDYVEFSFRPSHKSHGDKHGDGNKDNNITRFLIQRISISKPPPSNRKQ